MSGQDIVAMPCPNCDAVPKVRTGKQLSASMREVFLECLNEQCQYQWIAYLTLSRTLSPSATPNKKVVQGGSWRDAVEGKP
ncbi:MAG: ogr/Delta-like zinc finger family protein [Burkholderiaceae bacterium]